MSNPLKLSSLQAKEIHVQHRLNFQNPAVVLTGSNTSLLFRRVDTLESEVADLYANGVGGGGGTAMEVPFPTITSLDFETLTSQLLLDAPFSSTTTYNSFGRFAFPDTQSALLTTSFGLPNVLTNSHLRILNETDLTVFPITTSLVVVGTNSDASEKIYSMTSELLSARFIQGTWIFYPGS